MKKNEFERRVPVKIINNKILILCCGNTEKEYFLHYKGYFEMSMKNVKIKVIRSKSSSSLSMVAEALASQSKYNNIWVVFDKDIDPNFDNAIKKAYKHKIECAFSNKAFEYWLLLHLTDKGGGMSVEELKEDLSKLLGYKYEKNRNMGRICKNILEHIDEAETRAEKRHAEFISGHYKSYSEWCSCTTVYKLTKKLREWEDIT